MKSHSILALSAACLLLFTGCSRSRNSPPPATNTSSENRPDSRPTNRSLTKELDDSEKKQGLVIEITDGDTITILDDQEEFHIVRLQGIDAPERRQAYGDASRAYLARLLAGQQVTIEFNKRDRNDRIIAKVLMNDRDICLEQIKAGLAWHFKRFENEQSVDDRQLYNDAELSARSNKLGLWRDASPIPPWSFRENSKLLR